MYHVRGERKERKERKEAKKQRRKDTLLSMVSFSSTAESRSFNAWASCSLKLEIFASYSYGLLMGSALKLV